MSGEKKMENQPIQEVKDNSKAIYKALWPQARKSEEKPTALAMRIDSLEGKTIGELWDGLFRGDVIFSVLEKELSARYPGLKFVRWSEFPRDGDHDFPDWDTHPNLLSEMGCDAVIVTTGA